MNKDILDQYIYTYEFPSFLLNQSEVLIRSISFQSYVETTSPRYDTIEDYIEGFYCLFNKFDINSIIRQIALFYEKDNDFICTLVNKLLPYVGES